jgi:hypothetical protein
LILALLFLLSSIPASSLRLQTGCPEGTIELAREQIGNKIKIYCGTKEQYEKVKEIERNIAILDEQISGYRREIEKWNKDIPGYLEAFDEWVALDKEARKARDCSAIDLVAEVFLAHLEIRVRDRLKLTQQKLDEIWIKFWNSFRMPGRLWGARMK